MKKYNKNSSLLSNIGEHIGKFIPMMVLQAITSVKSTKWVEKDGIVSVHDVFRSPDKQSYGLVSMKVTTTNLPKCVNGKIVEVGDRKVIDIMVAEIGVGESGLTPKQVKEGGVNLPDWASNAYYFNSEDNTIKIDVMEATYEKIKEVFRL